MDQEQVITEVVESNEKVETSRSAIDFEPPLACVSRVIKAALPEGMLMTKDARCAFVRAAGIFVFYLTHCSNDFCRESKRQTIYTQDVINALKEIGFEDFESSIEEFLEVFRKEQLETKNAKIKSAEVDNEKSNEDKEGDMSMEVVEEES